MRVLLAYDGGPAGEKALHAAANWVREAGVELHLVHVVAPGDVHETPRSQRMIGVAVQSTVTGIRLDLDGPVEPLTEDRGQAYMGRKDRVEEAMREAVRRHAGDYAVVPHAVVADEPAKEIVDLAKRIGADVIAVGAHGRGRLSHMLLGSVAEAIVRNASVPVLVVGPRVV